MANNFQDKIRPIPPNSERLNVRTAKPLPPMRSSATEQFKEPPKVKCERVEEPTQSDEKDKKSKEPKPRNSEGKTEGDRKEQKTKGTEGDDEEVETICDVTKLKNLGSLDLKINKDMEAMNREGLEIPSRHEEGPRGETHSKKTAKRVVIKDAECKIYETDDVETIDDEADLPNVDL
uniref:PEST proteolytic signal-containing nuclear protein n=1 Tax=Bursaphelenchus xylophilus TaxID=6326 RepID=A0A1I7S1T9_BURXY